jgi:hypothetical protein
MVILCFVATAMHSRFEETCDESHEVSKVIRSTRPKRDSGRVDSAWAILMMMKAMSVCSMVGHQKFHHFRGTKSKRTKRRAKQQITRPEASGAQRLVVNMLEVVRNG